MGDDEGSSNPIGYIIAFSLISVFVLFFGILMFAIINNFAIGDLYALVGTFALQGTIPASFVNIADNIVSSIPEILTVIDFMWFGAFLSMAVSTLIFSYTRKRSNYFYIFTVATLGLIIFIYVGSYFMLVTDWFINEIFLRILPDINNYTPLFNWYIENFYIVTIMLVVINMIANFVDLDFSKFNKRKEDESFDEI